MSDLHLEVHPYYEPSEMANEKEQTLILAGDILPYVSLGDFMDENFFGPMAERFKNVIYVPGNHEYYHGDILEGDQKIREHLKQFKNFHFLNCDTITLDGVTIAGCTLWTNVDNANPITILNEAKYMADYWAIMCGNHRLTAGETISMNKNHVEFLDAEVDENTVVVTHHGPSYQSRHEKFRESKLNPFFYTDMDEFIEGKRPPIWIHGHTHCSMDYTIGETEIICNPKGYFDSTRYGEPENVLYEPALVVEV